MHTLVLMRHGTTAWSSQNRFAGWADVALSSAGEAEARRAGAALREAGFSFDLACCSYLRRSAATLELALEALGGGPVERRRDWRLNERHYGALQGMNRGKAALTWGNEQVGRWRRGFRDRPPPLDPDAPSAPARDPLYAGIDPALLPLTESLEEAALRVRPFWDQVLAPEISRGRRVLLVAHTSSLRGLAMRIEKLDAAAVEGFKVATAVPLVYQLAPDLSLIEKLELTGDWHSRLRRFFSRHKPRSAISWI